MRKTNSPEKVKKQKNNFYARKVSHSIFGRLTIIGFGIFLQLALMLAVSIIASLYFSRLYMWVSIVSAVVMIVTMIHIIQRDMIAEMKIPWMLLVAIFPVFGCVVYFLLSESRFKPKTKKLLKNNFKESQKYCPPREENKLNTLSEYLYCSTGLSAHANNSLKYFPDGESFWEELCSELEKAEKFIFMEYFIIQNGVMFGRIMDILMKKVNEGVEVRFLYDDVGSIGKVPVSFPDEMRKVGIKCYKFNGFMPVLSAVQNNRDHRKITVIDGKVGFMGGTNFADEYINVVTRFGKWKDSNIMIKGSAVNNLTLLFLQLYTVIENKNEDYLPYLNMSPEKFDEEGIVHPFGDGPRIVYKEAVAENLFTNMIERAQKRVWIITPYFVCDERLRGAVIEAAKRGVDVRVIIPSVPDKVSVYTQTKRQCLELLKNGVRVYIYKPGFIHSKNLLTDEGEAVCGTINFDYRSLYHHYECAAYIKDSPCIKDIEKDYEDTFTECVLAAESDLKERNIFKRIISHISLLIQPLL